MTWTPVDLSIPPSPWTPINVPGVGPNSNLIGSNRILVSRDGDDSNDGRTAAVRTIKRACSLVTTYRASGDFAPLRTTIFIASGDYTEDCPITVPMNVSLIGDNLRSVTVRPAVPTSNVFLLNSSCYCYGFTVRGHRLFPTALDITPAGYVGATGSPLALNTEQSGWAFSFAPGATIFVSPYIQNCSSISGSGILGTDTFVPGGGGLLVNPSVCAAGNIINSFVIDAFTQINLGGIGVKVMNGGYTQLVSFFTNFCQFSVLCVDGGHATLLNSNCTFGNYALWAHGGRQLANGESFGSLIEASSYTLSYAGAGLDFTKLSPSQGGDGNSDPNKYTIRTSNDGQFSPRIFSTATDERGDYYVGPVTPATATDVTRPQFRISQERGAIDGRAFYQSIFGFMAPFTLALTRKN